MKHELTNKRWRDVAIYLLVSLPIVALIEKYLAKVDYPYRLLAREFGNCCGFLLVLFAIYCTPKLLRYCGALPRMPRHTVFEYPPVWLPAVVASVIYAVWSWSNNAYSLSDLILWLALATAGIVFVGKPRFRKAVPELRAPKHNPGQAKAVASANSIDDWLLPEAAIATDKDDLLNVSRIADRFADALSRDLPCVLVGPVGSGKTSIFKLVASRLQDAGYLSCEIGVWGLKTEDIPGHVLKKSLEAASERYDVVSLQQIGSHHRELVRSGSKGFGAALDLVSFHSPKDFLARMDAMLQLADDRLIIFVEDLDRTSDPNASHTLSALLNLLKPLKRITYALATDFQGGRVDFIKLFDHVELLTPLDENIVVSVIEQLAQRLWDTYPDHVYYDRPSPAHKYFGQQSILSNWALKSSYVSPLAAICTVIDTPRKLKAVARNLYVAWGDLHGEVCLTELLIAVTLRIAAPEAWQMLLGNLERFLTLQRVGYDFGQARDEAKKEQDVLKAYLMEQFDQLAAHSKWSKASVVTLLAELLPHWIDTGSSFGGRSTQSATGENRGRYLRRLVSGAISEQVRDQQAIAAMESGRTAGDFQRLLELSLEHPVEMAQLLLYFVERTADRPWLQNFLRALINHAASHSPVGQPLGDHPVFLATVELIGQRDVSAEFVLECERALLKENLSSFIAFERRLCTAKALGDISNAKTLRHQLEMDAVGLLADANDWLRILPESAIDIEQWWELGGLLRLIHHPQITDSPPTIWSWAVMPLLNAARLRPAVLKPMLQLLVSVPSTDGREDIARFDREFVEAWIPDAKPRREFLEEITTFSGELPLPQSALRSLEKLKQSIAAYLAR